MTYDNIRKIAACHGDDYTTGRLRDYDYFNKMIAIDLGKQQALDADPKPIQQINFTVNLEQQAIIKEAKGIVLDFSRGTVKVF